MLRFYTDASSSLKISPTIILYRNCQTLTLWKASDPNLGHTLSICHTCVNDCKSKKQPEREDESEGDKEAADDFAADDHRRGAINGENHVVPLSPMTAPPATSSSSFYSSRSTRAEASVDGAKSLKSTLSNNPDSSFGKLSRRRPSLLRDRKSRGR